MSEADDEIRNPACICGHRYFDHEWNGHECGMGGCHCASFDEDAILDVVFDGPPSHESGRFVEVEVDGRSVSAGEWVDRGDGYWALRLRVRRSSYQTNGEKERQ